MQDNASGNGIYENSKIHMKILQTRWRYFIRT